MNRSLVVIAMVALALLVAGVAYNAGVSHGIAQSGKIVMVAPPAAGAPAAVPYAYPYPYYGWHPWGFGFFLVPLFFFFFFAMFIRALFWGARWSHGGRWHGGFDEWHRRAHERMMENGGDDPGRR